MKKKVVSLTGIVAILGFFLMAPFLAAGETSFRLGDTSYAVTVELVRDGDVFASAALPKNTVAFFGENQITLVDGTLLFFSVNESGYVVVDMMPGNVSDTERVVHDISPLVWTLDVFEGAAHDDLKAFGTAGLTAVDGHSGSYAFLAVVEPESRRGVVSGWTTSKRGSGILFSSYNGTGRAEIRPQVDYGKLRLEPGTNAGVPERLVVGYFDDAREGLEAYAETIALENDIHLKKCPSGYCTWYSDRFGGACNEEQLPVLAESLQKNFGVWGLDFVQIDDLWQRGVRENGPARDFSGHGADGPYPGGMKKAADAIHEHGFTAGLWLIPMAGTAADPAFADKQDFFVRSEIDYPEAGQVNKRLYSSINQKKGTPYETFWGGTSLDMTSEPVRAAVAETVRRMKEDWGIRYFKTDGLWTGMATEQLYVNNGYVPDDLGNQIFHDPTKTNVEAYRLGLATVRQAAGDAFILGCNVSQNMRIMAASYGFFDAMRIGPDNGSHWDEIKRGPWHGTNRYFYNGRVWWNDPDPVYVRDAVPLEQARTIVSWVALTGNLYAMSDWVPDLSPERMELVRKTIPGHQKKSVRPVDLFDADLPGVWLLTDESSGVRRDVAGLFNWDGENSRTFTETAVRLGLPDTDEAGRPVQKYVGYDFWNDTLLEPFEVLTQTLAPADCRIIAIRPLLDHPFLISTSRHVSSGILDVEREEWDEQSRTLTITVAVVAGQPTELRIYNPAKGELRREKVESSEGGRVTVEYKF